MAVLFGIQLFVSVVVGLYFFKQLKKENREGSACGVRGGNRHEMDKLARLRAVHLSEPLSERVRPARFADIVGQEEGIRALQAILCGKNPQHVNHLWPAGRGQDVRCAACAGICEILARHAVFAGRAVYRNGRYLCAL